MHWVVRDPRAGSWLKSEFEIMSLLDSSGHIFRSHVHVTGECPPVSSRMLFSASLHTLPHRNPPQTICKEGTDGMASQSAGSGT